MVWSVTRGGSSARSFTSGRGRQEGAVVVELEPLATITGRVVDADGNPVPGATIRPDLIPGGDFSLEPRQVATDS